MQAGLATAVGPGAASITVDYNGQDQTLPVIARRRTAIVGSIRMNDASGQQTIASVHAYVDGMEMGEQGTSHLVASLDVIWGGQFTPINDPAVDPGSRVVAVKVGQVDPPHAYASDQASYVTIIDRDTLETLTTVPLAVQSKTLSDLNSPDEITWTVQVATCSS